MKPMIAKRMNGTSQAKSISAKGNIINHFKITPCNKSKLFSICKIEIINVITVASRYAQLNRNLLNMLANDMSTSAMDTGYINVNNGTAIFKIISKPSVVNKNPMIEKIRANIL